MVKKIRNNKIVKIKEITKLMAFYPESSMRLHDAINDFIYQ
jgi:hypothetical protein